MADSGPEAASETRYKAGDVCRMADVQPYVLRYWESEFPVLAPDRGASGPRLYTPRDIRIIERIKKLLYDEGYTIAGAKKRLEGELKGVPAVTAVAPPEPPQPQPEAGRARGRVAVAVEPVAVAPPPLPVPVESGATVEHVELAGGDAVEDAPIAPEPPPVTDVRSRRRARVAVQPEAGSGPALFETEAALRVVSPAPAQEPAPSASASPSTGATSDRRVAMAITELKEILALLSREPD
jgi:DNA-binding transcriptional MerR regulator